MPYTYRYALRIHRDIARATELALTLQRRADCHTKFSFPGRK
jgi:hypothetical protein